MPFFLQQVLTRPVCVDGALLAAPAHAGVRRDAELVGVHVALVLCPRARAVWHSAVSVVVLFRFFFKVKPTLWFASAQQSSV